MAALYDDLIEHVYLSNEVKQLGPAKFEQEQLLAEALLDLDTPLFTSARDVADVKLAIVLQINFQVKQGIDPLYKKAESSPHTKQSVVYRDITMIDPRALEIVERLKERTGIDSLATRFGTLVSLRTNDS